MNLLKITACIAIVGFVVSCKTNPTQESEILSTIKVNGQTPQYTSNNNLPFFILLTTSEDDSYGLIPEKPINVGVGAAEQHKYMNSLAGPNGEPISYTRLGACCAFADNNLPSGVGFLDIYQVTYEGASEPVNLYLNLYHQDEKLYLPVGFTLRNN